MGRLWDNIWFRLLIFLLVTLLGLAISYYLRGILIPLAFAFIVAYIFNPVVDYLEERRIPRAVTIAFLLIFILAVIIGALVVIIPELIQETLQLAEIVQENIPEIQQKFEGLFERYSGYPLTETFSRHLQTLLASVQKNMPQILQGAQAVLAGAVAYTVNIVGYIVNFILFSVVSVYLLKDFHLLTAKLDDLIPLKYRATSTDVLGKINNKLRGFFRGQLMVGTILAVIYFAGLTLVGVPYSLLLALVGGYGQIIPYMGLILAMIPAALLALIKYGDFIHPFLAIIVYVIGQVLEGVVITPRVMAGKVGLHPVVVIVSILVFSKILGFLGLLIAVPLTTVIIVLLGELLIRYKNSSLYRSKTLDMPGGGM